MNIAMLVYNDFVNDLRVHKEARDLARAGHAVRVFATRSVPGLPAHEPLDGYDVERVFLSSGWRTRARSGIRDHERTAPASWRSRLMTAARRNRLAREWVARRVRARYGVNALAAIEAWKPDAIHAHDLDTLDFGARAATRHRVPLVYDSHELWRANNFLSKASRSTRNRWYRMEAELIGRADAVIATTESRAAKLREWYPGIDPLVVMNCQDASPVERTRLLRDRLGLDDERRILLYQGLMDRDRGILVAVDALSRLPESYVFVTIGSGRDRGEVDLRGRERAPGRVFTIPEVPHAELAPLTASADIGLSLVQDTSLSYRLSAPNKLFEFMRAGLPMVASDFPEVRRLFEQGDLGERVDPADARAVADAVVTLDSDSARRIHIAETARRLVAERYNWDRQMGSLVALYRRLAAS
jgi:glycosyltransferase involved in cell wall biosynthesis